MNLHDRDIARLTKERNKLLDENELLREQLLMLTVTFKVECFTFVRLTTLEERVLAILLKKPIATKEMLFQAIYWDRSDDAPESKIFDVVICKLRPKLAAHSITITTVWGRGWCLSPEMKMRLNALQGDSK